MIRLLRLIPPAVLATWPAIAPAQDAPAPPVPLPGATVPAAEAPICSGRSATWLGGTSAASDISTAGAALAGQLSASSTSERYAAFRVTAPMQALRVEAAAIGGGDPMIRLETPEGDLLAENDDSVGLDSRIEQSVGPGDYCIALQSVDALDLNATLQVTTAEMPPLLVEAPSTNIQACMTETEATALSDASLDIALPVRTETDGTVRYLRFSLATTTPLTLRAVSDGLDPNMVLFDGSGAQIAANDDADGLNSRLDFISGLPAGDYCLGVAPLSAGEGSIAVSAEALDRDHFLRDAWNRGELPPPLDAQGAIQDIDLATEAETVVLHDGGAKWLGFTLERETVMIVSAYGGLVGVDSKLALFAETGAVLAEDDDSADNLDARLGPVMLQPGRYRLALTDVNRLGESGAPIRPVALVFERFERVQ